MSHPRSQAPFSLVEEEREREREPGIEVDNVLVEKRVRGTPDGFRFNWPIKNGRTMRGEVVEPHVRVLPQFLQFDLLVYKM